MQTVKHDSVLGKPLLHGHGPTALHGQYVVTSAIHSVLTGRSVVPPSVQRRLCSTIRSVQRGIGPIVAFVGVFINPLGSTNTPSLTLSVLPAH